MMKKYPQSSKYLSAGLIWYLLINQFNCGMPDNLTSIQPSVCSPSRCWAKTAWEAPQLASIVKEIRMKLQTNPQESPKKESLKARASREHVDSVGCSDHSFKSSNIAPSEPAVPESDPRLRAENTPLEVLASDKIILFAEDEPVIRDLGIRCLNMLGYEAIPAENGMDALTKFRNHNGDDGPIRILITDINMPEMDGIELAARIRKLAPETVIVFNSGYQNNMFSDGELNDDRSFFVQKPCSLVVFRQILDEALKAI